MDKEKRAANNNNLFKYATNPRAFTLKRWFTDLLKGSSSQHEQIIERVATSLTTDQDVQDFGKLVTQIYESGYKKAVDDYRVQLEKHGLNIKFVSSSEQAKRSSD